MAQNWHNSETEQLEEIDPTKKELIAYQLFINQYTAMRKLNPNAKYKDVLCPLCLSPLNVTLLESDVKNSALLGYLDRFDINLEHNFARTSTFEFAGMRTRYCLTHSGCNNNNSYESLSTPERDHPLTVKNAVLNVDDYTIRVKSEDLTVDMLATAELEMLDLNKMLTDLKAAFIIGYVVLGYKWLMLPGVQQTRNHILNPPNKISDLNAFRAEFRDHSGIPEFKENTEPVSSFTFIDKLGNGMTFGFTDRPKDIESINGIPYKVPAPGYYKGEEIRWFHWDCASCPKDHQRMHA